LLAVHDELVKRLSTLGHVDLARRACESLGDPGLYQFDPATAYQRVRGAGSLDRAQLATLRELTIRRDAGARKIDLPPRMYIKDEVLVAIVRDKPADERALAKIKGMPRPVATEQFDAIQAALAAGQNASTDDIVLVRSPEESPAEKFQADALYA